MGRMPTNGPLRKNAANPRYFADASGKPVFLTGAHTWNDLVDMGPGDPPAALDFGAYLDFMLACNHNFLRMWAWDAICTWNADERVAPFPWARTGPGLAVDGKPKFDLTRHDEEYFARLRDRVARAGAAGIYTSVMMFEAWAAFTNNRVDPNWHVFAGCNNINGVDITDSEEDGVLRDWITLDNRDVVALQQAYVRKTAETLNALDNVLYEICNEAGRHSHDWQEHMIGVIRECERDMPAQHPVGTTGGMGTLNERLYASSADWMSPEGWVPPGERSIYQQGEVTWGKAPHDRGDKVVLQDTDHLWGIGGNVPWAWKCFCRGYNVLYMDPCTDRPWAFFHHPWWTEGSNAELRREMGAMLSYAGRMDLNAAVPHSELSSTGYCLADPGREYLVYQPEAGPFTLRLEPGTYAVEWHDPATGETMAGDDAAAGASATKLAAPFGGGCVAYLTGL
jgi:hypothetical protein